MASTVLSNGFRESSSSVNDLLIKITHISNIVIAHLEQCCKEATKRIEFLLKVEGEPSTRNTSYFKDYRRKFLDFYSGVFHGESNVCFIDRIQRRTYQSTEFSRALDTIILNLPKIGFHNVKPLELAALFRASEDTDDALKIMADVRAYFQGMSLDFLSR
jgi:hypothetical protein